MILSPRHNPLNLTVNIHARSSESSSFQSHPNTPRVRSPHPQSKQPLLSDTPLASPNSPYVLSRRPKRFSSVSHRAAILKLFGWFIVTLVVFYGGMSFLFGARRTTATTYTSDDGKTYEMLGQDELPDYATPIVVADKKGQPRWTVSIPESKDFPLAPAEYKQICSAAIDVSKHVEDVKKGNTSPDHGHKEHDDYYYTDPYYMDIHEAQAQGVLPGKKHDVGAAMAASDKGVEAKVGTSNLLGDSGKTCSKTLTFVMETEDAGLGNTLLGLWMAYGLSVLEDRAFFIDDSNWAYGSFETYFKPPPRPSCLPPSKSHITPCPHQARHLLVSPATTQWTWGEAFNREFMDKGKQDVFRQETIFSMLRAGYEALFELADHKEANGGDSDAAWLNHRVEELNSTVNAKSGIQIAMHVRHGDRHPMENQYKGSYLPLSKYTDEAREILYSNFEDLETGAEDFHAEMASKFLVASDDPDVYSSGEMSHALRAQDRIILASKSDESKSSTVVGVDDRLGWEGGFFSALFWSLGLDPKLAGSIPSDSPPPSYRDVPSKPNAYVPPPPSGQQRDPHHTSPNPSALRLRELVGRAYLLDLAVIGHADRIVCGVSSTGCRILAVMMGWEHAIEHGHWKNVDGFLDWWGISY